MSALHAYDLRELTIEEVDLVSGGNPIAAGYAGAMVGIAAIGGAFVVGAAVGYAAAAAYDALNDEGEGEAEDNAGGDNSSDNGGGNR